MSRISRLVVLVTALASLFGVLSATAGAVTWTNHGATAFTATGGQGQLSVTGAAITCLGGDASGTAPGSVVGNVYSVSGTLSFTSCTAAGSPASIECGYVLTATTVVPPIVTGNVDVTCGLYVQNVKLCHIEGSAHGQYQNEAGTLTVTTSNSLTVTGANCIVGSNDRGHLTPLDFRVISANPPTITRV